MAVTRQKDMHNPYSRGMHVQTFLSLPVYKYTKNQISPLIVKLMKSEEFENNTLAVEVDFCHSSVNTSLAEGAAKALTINEMKHS